MKNKVDQFNITIPSEYERYQKLMDDPYVTVEAEMSEFCKEDGSYVILVRYVENLTPRVDSDVEHGVDILNMDGTNDRERYEEIMNTCEPTQVVASFMQRHKTFILAMHWAKHKPVINLKTYKEGI